MKRCKPILKPLTRSSLKTPRRLNSCNLPLASAAEQESMMLGNFFLCGSSFDGPYWQGQTMTPQERVERSYVEWTRGGNYQPPDQAVKVGDRPSVYAPPWMILVTSNLWELAGAWLRSGRDGGRVGRWLRTPHCGSPSSSTFSLSLNILEPSFNQPTLSGMSFCHQNCCQRPG